MAGLGLLAPAFLLGALAAAVPIVLHLLERRPAVVRPFSAMRLLRPAQASEIRRRRIRQLLLLSVRVLALLLLALSFARPYSKHLSASPARPVTVVALDVSASMSAPGVFERARDGARRALQSAPRDHDVALIVFAETASVRSRATAERGRVLVALDSVRPGAGTTDYRSAFVRASETMAGAPGRLVVVTDLQPNGWRNPGSATLGPDVEVEVVDAGMPASNLAIVDAARVDGGLVAVVRNTGKEARASVVTMSAGGKDVGKREVMVPGNGRLEVLFAAPVPDEGIAVVSVNDGEGSRLDDVRFVVLDRPAARRVLVVGNDTASGEAFYVARALGAGVEKRFEPAVVAPSGLTRGAGVQEGGYAAVVLLGTKGLEPEGKQQLRRYVENGGGLLVAAGPAVDAALLEGLTGTGVVLKADALGGSMLPLAVTDVRHPVMRRLADTAGGLGGIQFERAAGIEAGDGARVLARLADGSPAIVEARAGSGRVMTLASDLGAAWNDLPRHPLFLPLVHEMVSHLSEGNTPRGPLRLTAMPEGLHLLPGVVDAAEFLEEAGAPRQVAVNVDPVESETGRMTEAEFEAAVTREAVAGERVVGTAGVAAGDGEPRDVLWRYGLALVLVALIGEALLARRTV